MITFDNYPPQSVEDVSVIPAIVDDLNRYATNATPERRSFLFMGMGYGVGAQLIEAEKVSDLSAEAMQQKLIDDAGKIFSEQIVITALARGMQSAIYDMRGVTV